MKFINLRKKNKETNNQSQVNNSELVNNTLQNSNINQQSINYQNNVQPQPNMVSVTYFQSSNDNQQKSNDVIYNQEQVSNSGDVSLQNKTVEISEQKSFVNMDSTNDIINIKTESSESAKEEQIEKLEEVPEELDVKLDPLNNSTNPIPVNPVAVDVVIDTSEQEKAKTSLFVCIGICFGLIFKPAKTIVENTKKYSLTRKAFMIYLWMLLLSVALCVASRLVLGCFIKTISPVTGKYVLNFDLGRMFMLDNYTGWLIATVVLSGLFVLLVSLVYYACSFMNSKGISFGTYLTLSTLGCFPITISLLIFLPVGALFSSYLGIILFVIGFLYGYLIFLVGVFNTLKFNNVDNLLKYNLVNMLIIGFVLGIIMVAFVRYTSYDLSYLISVAGLG